MTPRRIVPTMPTKALLVADIWFGALLDAWPMRWHELKLSQTSKNTSHASWLMVFMMVSAGDGIPPSPVNTGLVASMW